MAKAGKLNENSDYVERFDIIIFPFCFDLIKIETKSHKKQTKSLKIKNKIKYSEK